MKAFYCAIICTCSNKVSRKNTFLNKLLISYWHNILDMNHKRTSSVLYTHVLCVSILSFLWALITQGTVILTLSFTPSDSLFSNVKSFFLSINPFNTSLCPLAIDRQNLKIFQDSWLGHISFHSCTVLHVSSFRGKLCKVVLRRSKD